MNEPTPTPTEAETEAEKIQQLGWTYKKQRKPRIPTMVDESMAHSKLRKAWPAAVFLITIGLCLGLLAAAVFQALSA